MKTSLCVGVSSGKIIAFQISSWLQYIVKSGFKQVGIAYLAVMSHLDKVVQPSYMLSTYASTLVNFELQNDNANYGQFMHC